MSQLIWKNIDERYHQMRVIVSHKRHTLDETEVVNWVISGRVHCPRPNELAVLTSPTSKNVASVPENAEVTIDFDEAYIRFGKW